MFIESLSFLHNSFGYFVQFLHEVVGFNKIILTYIYILMMPKCSPVTCTTLTLEQPVPENRKVQKTPSNGGVRCGAGQIPSEG